MFLRERDNGNCICKIEQKNEKKKQTTWLVISRRDPETNKLKEIARFAYWSKMRPIDFIKRKAHRTYPYLENATDKDLLDEARRRNLLNLDAVSDGAIYEEALNRGLIPVNDEYVHAPELTPAPVQEAPPEDDCVVIYDNPDQVALEPAPQKKRGLFARFRRRKE